MAKRMNRTKEKPEPLEQLMRIAEQEAKRTDGGIAHPVIESLCQRLGSELRISMQKQGLDCNQMYTLEMVAVSLALRLSCEILFRERRMSPDDKQWFSGFGNKSQWTTQNGNHRTNGSKR